MQTHHHPRQRQQRRHPQPRRRRLSVGAATAVAVAAAASAANGAGVEGFHVAGPPLAAAAATGPAAVGSTGRRQEAHIDGCCSSGDGNGGLRPLPHRQRVAGGAAGASRRGLGAGSDSCLCFCLAASSSGDSGKAATKTTRWLCRSTTMYHSRIGDGRSRTSGVWGGGWLVRELGSTTTQLQSQKRRGRSSDGRSHPSGLMVMMARAGNGGSHGGGDGYSFKKKGDLPSLVVGAGLLVARHRNSIRASNERRNVVIKTGEPGGGGSGRVSHDEEEAAAVAKMGGGVGATVSAASAGLRMGLGDTSASRRFAAASSSGGSGGGGGGERTSVSGRQRQRMNTSGSGGVSSLASSRGRWGGGVDDEGEETGEWQEEGGTQEGEIDGAEEWTEVEEAADERLQQRRSTEAERRSVPVSSASAPRTSLEVSLDRSVIPEPVNPLVVWGAGVVLPLSVIAVTARIPRWLGGVGSPPAAYKTGGGSSSSSTTTTTVGNAGGLRYSARLWAGSLKAWGMRRAQQWERAFGPEEIMLPADDWSVCTLLEKTREGGSVFRYRFGLKSSPNAVLPLELGQELTLCGLDSANQVVHGNYMPLTPRKQRGYFDIVMKRDKGELDDGLKSTRSAREFSHFLDNLPLGDEIAVKPGREGLVYGGPDQPITDLVLIATGVGVVPMIQMVHELLPSSSSSVTSASVIWLNEKTEDFALYGELEKAFFLNHRKLDVSCIVERDLFGNHLEANANVCEAAPDFKVGTLAAVAGPEFFTRKVTDYLMRRGYPEESVIKL
eukprot:g13005.t1